MPLTNPIGKRLKSQMQHCGISSADLAKRADVKTSFIYDVLSGKSANPSPVRLARLAESLGISLSALVGSKELAAEETPSLPEDYVAIPRLVAPAPSRALPADRGEDKGEPSYFRAAWVRERLGAEPEDLRMLHVQGDSMEPTLRAGDLVIVNTAQKTATPPGIFVLFDGLGLVPKRLEHLSHEMPAHIRIISDNPHYSTYERSVAETYIIGRVVWFAREL